MDFYQIGDVLPGGYRVIDIKRGGMGVVYICHQPPDRFYAVKTASFRPGTGGHDSEAEDQFFRYFRDEVDLWIRLSNESRHENIVQALLYNDQEHLLFLEYVDGLSIHEAMVGKPIHPSHALQWSIGICRGMAHMHEEFRLIHRDLKPQNVLIRHQNLVPKISDMGIAKVLEEGASGNTIIGTQGYRAPETWEGETDFVSDVFSFGATLYAMITGAPPKSQASPFATFKSSDPPHVINPECPEALSNIASRCIQYMPNDRYQSFQEVLDDLEKLPPYDTEEFQDGYLFCEKHGFFTPNDLAEGGCLFCDQTRRHTDQLEHAKTLAASVLAQVAATVAEPPLAGTVTAAQATAYDPAVDATQVAPSLRGHTPTATAPGASTPSTDDVGPNWIKWAAITVVALVGVLYLVGALLNSGDKDKEPVKRIPGKTHQAAGGSGETPAKRGDLVDCGSEKKCPVQFKLDTSINGFGQTICPVESEGATHPHYVCDICGHRYAKNERGCLIDGCKGTPLKHRP